MKKVVVLVGTLVTAVAVQAGILNWQVDSGLTSPNGTEICGGNLYLVDGDPVGANKVGTGVSFSEIGKGASFYVEFVNYMGESIAVSGTETYANLVEKGFIAEGTSEVAMAPWHPEVAAAPEPTSAMLMMMGVAFLGLKRRKA